VTATQALAFVLAAALSLHVQDPAPSSIPPGQQPPPSEKPAEKPPPKPDVKPEPKGDVPKSGEQPGTKGDEKVDGKSDAKPEAKPAAVPGAPGAPVASGAPAAPSEPQPASKPAFDYTARAGATSFEAELRRLQAAHPTRLRVTSLGKSRAGHDLWLATLGDLSAGDPDKKPALLVASAFDPAFDGRPAGPEAALFGIAILLDKAEHDATTARSLARTSVYVVCAPDPDAALNADVGPGRACRLDRNFPADWKPWSSETCAQGPYPLSEPETRALARFLAGRPNIGAVLLLSHGIGLGVPANEAASSELERILCERLAPHAAAASLPGSERVGAAEALARRIEAFAREPGSLAAFCRSRLSAFVLVADPWHGPVGGEPPAPAGFACVPASIERLSAELPRVACNVAQVERLREKLWLVDIDVENEGLLPTLDESERARFPGSVWFEASGARVLQTGVARTGRAEENAAQVRPGVWMLGHLDGREKLRAHLLVEAPEGAALELAFRTRRDGETRCSVVLK
jgi:hypothetical protein